MKPTPSKPLPNSPLTVRALELAAHAHAGQFREDKVTPYVNHVIEAARYALELFDARYTDIAERVREIVYSITLLHDTNKEAVHIYPDEASLVLDLSHGTSLSQNEADAIRNALYALNRRNHPTYLAHVLACKANWFAIFPKRGDHMHNMSDLRPGSRRDKYELSMHILTH